MPQIPSQAVEAGAHAPASTAAPGGKKPILRLRDVHKAFGSVIAVDGVDLDLDEGEVHAILGENGAGKTTLMNIVAGFVAADQGQVIYRGEAVRFAGPRDALSAGIGMVHQHFRLVDKFTVAENLALGRRDLPHILSGRVLLERVNALSERFGLAVEPDTPVWRLSIGEQQRVEILRALGGGAEVLILDEPTSVLTPQESAGLCTTLREMAAEGTTVVFISHKLQEVLNVADRVTVMRNGRRLKTLRRAECDAQMLARLMVGEARTEVSRPTESARTSGEPVLAARRVDVEDERGNLVLKGLDLEVNAGEIVAVAGVAGNGQRELSEVMTGLRRPVAGSIRLNGTELAGKGARTFIDTGIAHIPEDRRGMGLVPTEPIWRNAILKGYRRRPISRGPIVSRGEAKRFASGLAESVHLSTDDVDTPAGQLSGGNSQKLLAGRELVTGNRLVVAMSPTQGLDVSAAAAVWQALLDARSQGVAVLLISYDLDELMRLADRLVVLYEGALNGEFNADELDREEIGLRMGGVSKGHE